MKKIVIVSDMQVPFHDRKAITSLIAFVKSFKPDEVVTIGDEIDFNTLSRFAENTPEQYEQTLGKDRDETFQILHDLQVTHMVRSNHSDRLYSQIMHKIPSFLSLPELRFEKFMRLDELGITYHSKPYQIAPNWIAVHGDHTPIKSQGGLSALEAARRYGRNVISGHTHRMGRSSFTEAMGGKKGRILHGVEVGNLCDMSKMGYTKGYANWQSGFAIMYVDGNSVEVQLIYIEKDGSFMVNGKVYGRPHK
jgi:predicted phosphodiesterase